MALHGATALPALARRRLACRLGEASNWRTHGLKRLQNLNSAIDISGTYVMTKSVMKFKTTNGRAPR